MSETGVMAPVPSERAARQMMHYDANKKSAGVAFALWFFLGIVGGHRFYMGRIGSGIVMILLDITIVGIIITVIWSLVDAFCIPGWVRDYNNRLIASMP